MPPEHNTISQPICTLQVSESFTQVHKYTLTSMLNLLCWTVNTEHPSSEFTEHTCSQKLNRWIYELVLPLLNTQPPGHTVVRCLTDSEQWIWRTFNDYLARCQPFFLKCKTSVAKIWIKLEVCLCTWARGAWNKNFVHYFLHPACVMDHPSCTTGPASQRVYGYASL